MHWLTFFCVLFCMPYLLLADEYEEGIQALRQKEYANAHDHFEEAYMGQNDARAIGNLAVMKMTGLGCDRNQERAKRLMIISAHNGDRIAQKNIATMYEHGICIAKESDLAAIWFKESVWKDQTVPKKSLGAKYLTYQLSSTLEVHFLLKVTLDNNHMIPRYKLGVGRRKDTLERWDTLPSMTHSQIRGTEYKPRNYSMSHVLHKFDDLIENFDVPENRLSPHEYYRLGYMNRYGIFYKGNIKKAYVLFAIAERLYLNSLDQHKASRAALEAACKLSTAELTFANDLLRKISLRERVVRTHEPYDALMKKYGAKLPPLP